MLSVDMFYLIHSWKRNEILSFKCVRFSVETENEKISVLESKNLKTIENQNIYLNISKNRNRKRNHHFKIKMIFLVLKYMYIFSTYYLAKIAVLLKILKLKLNQ